MVIVGVVAELDGGGGEEGQGGWGALWSWFLGFGGFMGFGGWLGFVMGEVDEAGIGFDAAFGGETVGGEKGGGI